LSGIAVTRSFGWFEIVSRQSGKEPLFVLAFRRNRFRHRIKVLKKKGWLSIPEQH